MINLLDFFRSSRADKVLAYTDDIFDSNLSKHQDAINAQLTELIDQLKDIKNNLISTDKNKALSANQGRILKSLIDAKVIDAGGVIWDLEPQADSMHAITSGGVYNAIDEVKPVYLTQDEYNYLVQEGLIDENKDYNIYEDEEI